MGVGVSNSSLIVIGNCPWVQTDKRRFDASLPNFHPLKQIRRLLCKCARVLRLPRTHTNKLTNSPPPTIVCCFYWKPRCEFNAIMLQTMTVPFISRSCRSQHTNHLCCNESLGTWNQQARLQAQLSQPTVVACSLAWLLKLQLESS